MKQNLFGKSLPELQDVVAQLGLPRFTAKQMAQWLYQKDITSIDEMTNLSKKARGMLSDKYLLGLSAPISAQESKDGTKKYLFSIGDNGYIESAFIPESKRNTICVSSQVGCKMRCLFCMTGRQGLKSNLTACEILNQIRSLPEWQKLTNIVFMGMGEPLDNLDAVLKSLDILTSNWGFGWSKRKITVSTIGIVPAMRRFLIESECHLAVSLHSPFESERKMLMPVSHVHSIESIVKEIKRHDLGRHRRISFEYIVFGGINDTSKHVKEMARVLNGINCRINLIRFHEIPKTPLASTDERRLQIFKDALSNKGIFTSVRASRGQDIDAACGLLSTKNQQPAIPEIKTIA